MTLRAGHGNGAGVPRIEVLPADELPQPRPIPPSTCGAAPPDDGLTPEQRQAREWGRQGGLAKAARSRLLRSLGLVELAVGHLFHAYEAAGQAWVEKHLASLAADYDGIVEEGPASIVITAGMQMAASRFLYDQGKLVGDAKLLGQASSLGNDHRQNVHAAMELQSREAARRASTSGRRGGDIDSQLDAEAKR